MLTQLRELEDRKRELVLSWTLRSALAESNSIPVFRISIAGK